jgi:hypothetical protein
VRIGSHFTTDAQTVSKSVRPSFDQILTIAEYCGLPDLGRPPWRVCRCMTGKKWTHRLNGKVGGNLANHISVNRRKMGPVLSKLDCISETALVQGQQRRTWRWTGVSSLWTALFRVCGWEICRRPVYVSRTQYNLSLVHQNFPHCWIWKGPFLRGTPTCSISPILLASHKSDWPILQIFHIMTHLFLPNHFSINWIRFGHLKMEAALSSETSEYTSTAWRINPKESTKQSSIAAEA